MIAHGTGYRAQFDQTAAGKTGTTEGNGDAWFTGYTCKLTASVWMGYPTSNASMAKYGSYAFGGGFPAIMWRKFMTARDPGPPELPLRPARPTPARTRRRAAPGRRDVVRHGAGVELDVVLVHLDDRAEVVDHDLHPRLVDHDDHGPHDELDRHRDDPQTTLI